MKNIHLFKAMLYCKEFVITSYMYLYINDTCTRLVFGKSNIHVYIYIYKCKTQKSDNHAKVRRYVVDTDAKVRWYVVDTDAKVLWYVVDTDAKV